MTDLKPGIYPNTPYDVYASWPAVRASTLNGCAKTMAHGREKEINPTETSKALEFGTAFHTALLEPARFRAEYVVAPKCDGRTKIGKAEWAAFQAEYGHLTPIISDEYAQATAMINSVYGRHDAAELLANSTARELSFLWRDEDTGLLCKGRIDVLTSIAGYPVILDLKSTRDASQQAFQRQMTNLRYYGSMAWYRRGLNVLAPHDRKCVLLPVEKTPPYCCKPYEITREALDKGEEEMIGLLRQYAAAKESGIWEGYTAGIGLIDLPSWKNKQND